jgi:preprotein translocase subunit SecA
MPKLPPRFIASDVERPQRYPAPLDWLDKTGGRLRSRLLRPVKNSTVPLRLQLRTINQLADQFSALNQCELDTELRKLKDALAKNGLTPRGISASFALIREYSTRTLQMRHFDVQVLGGLALMYGNVAEMHTGEGKTLTATLAAATAALAGVPVHVVTVNDYLSERDADQMRPLYEALGLTVGVIINGKTPEQRVLEYGCNITYCTNKELVFDYLKDSIASGFKSLPLQRKTDQWMERLKPNNEPAQPLMLRGLHFAIVDEADSVLLDEACTPLIIAGAMPLRQNEIKIYRQALRMARQLKRDIDFKLRRDTRSLLLTAAGERHIVELCRPLGSKWQAEVRSLELVRQALSAMYLFSCDIQYLVRDGKVQIIDEHTGRLVPDRHWEKGLHQLIELKEGCQPTAPQQTLARISFQTFFRYYHHLAGMTGTAAEVRGEILDVYEMPVIRIPCNRKSQRINRGVHVFSDQQQKREAVVAEVKRSLDLGQSVLIGTDSLGSSEEMSRALEHVGINHQILNARQDALEAEIVASAGQPEQVTIATSMAGRGTDISIAESVAKSGGLHVILTGLHESARLDRQLQGRCARQGDPGSTVSLLAIDDTLVPEKNQNVLRKLPLGRNTAAVVMMRFLQKKRGLQRRQQREDLLVLDEKQREMLAFGNSEK